MDIRIEKLSPNDIDKFTELIRVFERVFEMRNFTIPDDKYLQQLLTREDFIVFVAVSNDNVVSGLTSYILQQYYSVSPLVYIYDLAVKTELQRHGVGKLLVANLTNYCKDKGFEEVFVQADKVDDHAIEFYRSTGATEEQVVHFYYPLIGKTS
jgi:aminoglycoside 3-N-acetyltransferase I